MGADNDGPGREQGAAGPCISGHLRPGARPLSWEQASSLPESTHRLYPQRRRGKAHLSTPT